MSKASLDELLVALPELHVGNRAVKALLLRHPVDVDLDEVLAKRPALIVDVVVEAGPVDFRMLRALRRSRRASLQLNRHPANPLFAPLR